MSARELAVIRPSFVPTSSTTVQRRSSDVVRSKSIPRTNLGTFGSSGTALDPALQAVMGERFSRDFSNVRVHTDARSAALARGMNAHAYTVGSNIGFAFRQHAPETSTGRFLIAHELAHVVQQSGGNDGSGASPRLGSSDLEAQADAAANAALAGQPASLSAAQVVVQRRAAPYIKKVTVHLAPSQSAELAWEGTPPAGATGSDAFPVSTGKGYSDPDDPQGTCVRSCCSNEMTQCAPPWNKPERVGACCTFYGNSFWTGTPREEHNGWRWWTPIQPWYSKRGIALHQHPEVTGQPIGHGCVRMDEANAKRIHDYSNGTRTNVTIEGRAAPVLCDAARRCGSTRGAGSAGVTAQTEPLSPGQASVETDAVPGLEGAMS